MALLTASYARAIYRVNSHLAAWPPTTPLNVGDVVLSSDGVVEPITNVADLGLIVSSRAFHPGDEIRLQKGVTVAAKVETVGAPSVASAIMSLSKSGSYLLAATGLTGEQLIDVERLGDKLSEMRVNGRWREDWRLVTSVIRARGLTALISRSSESSGTVSVEPGGQLVRAGGRVEITRGEAAAFVSSDSTTPLYRAYAFHSKLFGRPKWRTMRRFGTDSNGSDFRESSLRDAGLV